ncbi:MAG: hypothetical protein LBD11_02190 [Candidatus Peribacteria bacterium]|jgi:phenylalanyl-tRNA synthetase beta chain|nr:hypothetical protein [Candidatus Peribacteria bacterium]
MANETFTEKAKTILTALGFQVHENTITAPIWRGPEDMNIPEDITEEVARIRGYEHVENTPAKTEIKNQAFSGMVQNMRITEQVLVERCRCLQTETYPWVSEKMVEPFLQPLRPTGTPLYSGENSESQFTPLSGGEGGGRAKSRTTEEGVASRLLELQNPVNPECPLLRDSFIYQFIQIANKNAKFFDEFSIFDTGKIRTTNAPHNDEAKEFAKAHLDEQFHTGILLYKKSAKSREEDTLLEAKGIVQMLLNGLELDGEISYEATTLPYFHPKKQGNILYKGIKI